MIWFIIILLTVTQLIHWKLMTDEFNRVASEMVELENRLTQANRQLRYSCGCEHHMGSHP